MNKCSSLFYAGVITYLCFNVKACLTDIMLVKKAQGVQFNEMKYLISRTFIHRCILIYTKFYYGMP